MTGFGASAPYEELYRHFGITPETVVDRVIDRLGQVSAIAESRAKTMRRSG
jgi:transketolase